MVFYLIGYITLDFHALKDVPARTKNVEIHSQHTQDNLIIAIRISFYGAFILLPHVIVYNAVSADGRIDWFPFDMYLYYGIAAEWNVDAALMGSNTILMSGEEVSKEDETAFEPMKAEKNDTRPMLVIADSKGRIRSWHDIKKWPYIRDAVALCSRSTPKEYLEYLEKRHIDYIVAGDDQVDFKAALEELDKRYGVKKLRVDSGGTLNGVLLRAGLVNEVHLLINPALVGGTSCRSMFRAPDLASSEGVIDLRLKSSKKLKGGIVHLHYEVRK